MRKCDTCIFRNANIDELLNMFDDVHDGNDSYKHGCLVLNVVPDDVWSGADCPEYVEDKQ